MANRSSSDRSTPKNRLVDSDPKSRVRSQFGPSAAAYATSDVHARGESLAVLRRVIQPQPSWRAVDVAAGAGHTALLFAPLVREMVAVDLTAEMLDQARRLARAQGIENLSTVEGDAENLPFADGQFDLLTCRLALHHFPRPDLALAEFARVLRPDGKLGLTDNITVDGRPAADVYNELEMIRDPSHVRVLSRAELQNVVRRHGFHIDHVEQLSKEFEFHEWADRQRVTEAGKGRLLAMMKNLPAELVPLFRPRWSDSTLYFSLWELALVATRRSTN